MRKRRTRSHIIADLSANHVERHILLCGYSAERVIHDYGVDMLLYTYTEEGEIENESIRIQLKATDHLPLLQDAQTIPFLIDRTDLVYWLQERFPVILIVYDAADDAAYWVYVQAYFQQRPDFHLEIAGATYTIHVPRSHVVNIETIKQFARFKAQVLMQLQGVVHDEG